MILYLPVCPVWTNRQMVDLALQCGHHLPVFLVWWIRQMADHRSPFADFPHMVD